MLTLTCEARRTGTVVLIDHVVTGCAVFTGTAGALINVVLTVVAIVTGDTGTLVGTLTLQVLTCRPIDTLFLRTHILVHAL